MTIKSTGIEIVIASTAKGLRAALAGISTSATVEAEYGKETVPGSLYTLAHHGENSGNRAPCLEENHHGEEIPEIVGMSHCDLDALGGVLALIGRKPRAASFWELAAEIDLCGPHKIKRSSASAEDKTRLYAWYAWSEGNRLYPPRTGEAIDASAWVTEGLAAVEKIISGDPEMLEAGQKYLANETALAEASDRGKIGRVQVRESDRFVNFLYGESCAVVAYNSETGSVTASLEAPIKGVSVEKLLQEYFGPQAGGRAEIGGSPRGKKYSLEIAKEFAERLDAEIAASLGCQTCDYLFNAGQVNPEDVWWVGGHIYDKYGRCCG